MACNSCSKPYNLFRKEKGCPGCGFSYCSKCLDNKLFLEKLNSDAKVCSKCKLKKSADIKKPDEVPDTFYKRMGVTSNDMTSTSNNGLPENSTDKEIEKRLQSLKEDNWTGKGTSDTDILKRLQSLKSDQPTISDAELHQRLANLKGTPTVGLQNKPVLIAHDTRTEQEQANDLMKQYLEQANIDTQYQEGFNKEINHIEERIQKLRGDPTPATSKNSAKHEDEPDDEESIIKKVIEKAKSESLINNDDDEMPAATNDELPFCEICNEDARMRCLGCHYLFCKRCWIEHKDDDDCDRYEPYHPPKIN